MQKFALLDMDGTIIENEIINEMAKLMGKEKEVAEITEKAMHNGMPIEEALRIRLSLMPNFQKDMFNEIKPRIRFKPGFYEALKFLKENEFKVYVCSHSFMDMLELILSNIPIDGVFANILSYNPLRVSSMINKAQIARSFAKKGFVVGVGDGSNDREMLLECNLAIVMKRSGKVAERLKDFPYKANDWFDVLEILKAFNNNQFKK